MKSLRRLVLSSLFLSIILIACNSEKLYGQGKIIISGGFGFPELVNIGVRYQQGQTGAGITLGALPIFSYLTGAVAGDFYYNFGGSSRLTEIRPWYGKIGVSYLQDESYYDRDKFFYSNLRIGRNFNTSEKAGIDIYAGMSFQLFHDRLLKIEHNLPYGYYEQYLVPSLGISYFRKL